MSVDGEHTPNADNWWERNWWIIVLLLGCLFVGFLVGFGIGNYMSN